MNKIIDLISNIMSVDTGLKLNVHKTFNVLCKFNLRYVSTGMSNAEKTGNVPEFKFDMF